MKRKHSDPPAAPQEGLPNPLAKVSITPVAADADHIVQELTKDPARLSGVVRQLIKYSARLKKRAEASRRGAQKANESQWERTNRRKPIFRNIIEDEIKKDPSLRLPGKQTELARRAQGRWPKHDKAPAIHTLRHWLAEMYPKK